MNRKIIPFSLLLFSILTIIGCLNIEDNMKKPNTDNFYQARVVAWQFISEKGWDGAASEDWQSAVVEKKMADHNYELIDLTYLGKEALSVSFIDKENVVVGTPLILVEPNTYEVIGYMLGE